jgi:hypothetical protein
MVLAVLGLMQTDAGDRGGLIAAGSPHNWYACAVPVTRTVAAGAWERRMQERISCAVR